MYTHTYTIHKQIPTFKYMHLDTFTVKSIYINTSMNNNKLVDGLNILSI